MISVDCYTLEHEVNGSRLSRSQTITQHVGAAAWLALSTVETFGLYRIIIHAALSPSLGKPPSSK